MSEEISNDERELPLSQRPVRLWGCMILLLVGVLFVLAFVAGMVYQLELIYHLVMGWLFFVVSNVKNLETNLEMIACGVGALGMATYGLHYLLNWLRGERAWKWPWTLTITSLMLMLFAASISMTGMIHQLGWMMREPLTQSTRRTSLVSNTNYAKQFFYLLIEYDDEFGDLPPNLEALLELEGVNEEVMKEFRFSSGRGKPSEPWLYFGAGESILVNEPGTSSGLLISPRPISGKWIMLRSNGSVKQLTTEELKNNCPEVLVRLPNLLGES